MDHEGPKFISPIFVALLGIMSAAVVLTVYHCVVIAWCRPSQHADVPTQRNFRSFDPEATSIEISTTNLLPTSTHTYGKGDGLVSGGESVCPVCLCDFKDGETVRQLPECMHYFHVPCIDMWLQSHSSCPMCRSETTPVRTLPAPVLPPVNSQPRFGAVASAAGVMTMMGV